MKNQSGIKSYLLSTMYLSKNRKKIEMYCACSNTDSENNKNKKQLNNQVRN